MVSHLKPFKSQGAQIGLICLVSLFCAEKDSAGGTQAVCPLMGREVFHILGKMKTERMYSLSASETVCAARTAHGVPLHSRPKNPPTSRVKETIFVA